MGIEINRETIHKILYGGFNSQKKLLLIDYKTDRSSNPIQKHQVMLYRTTMYHQLESEVMSPSYFE